MAELARGNDVRKGTDPNGTPIVTYEDSAESVPSGASARPQTQGVLARDRYGHLCAATDIGAQSPAISKNVTDGALVTLLSANAARAGFYIIHMGATIWWGLDQDADLATFKANALPLLSTQPLTQQFFGPAIYKGPIYAVCADSEGPTAVKVQEIVY